MERNEAGLMIAFSIAGIAALHDHNFAPAFVFLGIALMIAIKVTYE